MKVSYTQCDICDQKIKDIDCRYKYTKLVRIPDPNDPINSIVHEESLDVCSSCFERLREWVKSEIEKKGENNGPST